MAFFGLAENNVPCISIIFVALEFLTFSQAFLETAKKPSGSATSIAPLPFTAIAFNFLDPITAPIPHLAATLDLSTMTQAPRTKFSPAGPMQSTFVLSPSSVRIKSTVSETVFPQMCLASFILILLSTIAIYTGCCAFPVTITVPIPAAFSSRAKSPPALAEPTPPEKKFFVSMLSLVAPGADVPTRRPAPNSKTFWESKGDTPGFTFS
ncbi:hypothetical protein ES703_107548 [subsurface metagenome]